MKINDSEYEQKNPFGLDTDSDFHDTRRNVTLSLIMEYGRGKKKIEILDAGCGKGNITWHIFHQIEKAEIDAIDISDKAITEAAKFGRGVHFLSADAMTFNGFGYLYDVILLNNIYEHIENPVGMLLNLKRLLNVDGIFIISTPNRYHIKNLLRKILGLKIAISEYHITEYSIGQLYDHHAYANLEIIKLVAPIFGRGKFRIIDFLAFKIMQPLIDEYLKLLNSKTRLGSLVFVVSKKKS